MKGRTVGAPAWLDRKRTDFRRSPRPMHRIRGNACDGVHPVSSCSSSGICAGSAEGTRATTGGSAFSGITEVLGNRSSGLVSSSTTRMRFCGGRVRGSLGRYKEKG